MIEQLSKPWASPPCPQPLTAHRPHLQEVRAADSKLGLYRWLPSLRPWVEYLTSLILNFHAYKPQRITTPLQGFEKTDQNAAFVILWEAAYHCLTAALINVAPLPPAYRSLDFEAGWQTADCCIHDPQSSLALHISVQFWGLRNPTKNLPKDTICIPHLTPTPYLLWGDPKFLSRNSITCLSILSMPSREIGTWKY